MELGGDPIASHGMDGDPTVLVGVPWQWVGVPVPMGLTGWVGVSAITPQESAAEAAAAAEVSGGTAGFPGTTKPW